MGRRAILLIASILVAATGTALVALYVNGQRNQIASENEVRPVLVAAKEIPAGTTGAALAALVETRNFASGAIPGDAIAGVNGLKGLTARAPIAKGSSLLRSQFTAQGEATDANPLGLEPDTIAVSVTLTDPARVGGYVQNDSYVGLFVTQGAREGAKQGAAGQTSLLVDKPVRVLRITAAQLSAPTPGQTIVTLQLRPDDAPPVIYASQKDVLYMALVQGKDADLSQARPFAGRYTSESS